MTEWANGYQPPFYAEIDKDDIVAVYDADNNSIMHFNQVTQIPLNDEKGLREERDMWFALAEQIAAAMNAFKKSP